MLAGFPRFGLGVCVASTLDTSVGPVTPAGTVGVVESEGWEVANAESVASNDVPKPPTGAQRRSLSTPISMEDHRSQTRIMYGGFVQSGGNRDSFPALKGSLTFEFLGTAAETLAIAELRTEQSLLTDTGKI